MSISGTLLKFFTKVSLTVVEFLSPNRTKRGRRILFLSSFNAACVKAGVLEENTLKTLNEALSVAEDGNSLDIGFHMAPSIWSRNEIKDMLPHPDTDIASMGIVPADAKSRQFLTLNQAQSFTDNVLEQTPAWLKYDIDEMRSDVLDLVTDNEVRLP